MGRRRESRAVGNPTFGNPRWEDARLRVLIVRLSPFPVAERSFTHLFLACEVRRAVPEAYLDMLFVPPLTPPRSVLGSERISDFDLLLLSNSYMLELLNVPALLRSCRMLPEAADRTDADPIVILGGANAMAAHALVEPLESTAPPPAPAWASFVDALFFGEGEGEVGRIASILERCGRGRRGATLRALAEALPALWVPRISQPISAGVRKAVLREPRPECIPTDYPLLDGEEAATARLQITFGCAGLCSFCFEAYDRRPYREVPLGMLLDAARELKRNTGAEKLELFSFNFSYHAAFPTLVLELGRLFGSVSFMSQRIDVLARNLDLIPFEIAAGKRSYTLGIEGVSARLRAFLQKGVATEDIRAVISSLVRHRVRELKLFYIITGYEEGPDIDELGAFLSDLARDRRQGGVPRVILSFTYLLRMPFTPLRYDPPVLDRERLEAILVRLKSVAASRGMELRLAGEWGEHVTCQLLASAGYGARSLIRALDGAGIAYDGALPARAWPVVQAWMANAPRAAAARRGQACSFPFDFVEGAPDPSRLEERYRAASSALAAHAPEEPRRGAGRTAEPDIPGMEELARARQLLEKRPVFARVLFPAETAGFGPEWRSAWLMRATFRAEPELVDSIVAVEQVVPRWDVPWYGTGIVRIVAWRPDELLERLASGAGPLTGPSPGVEVGVFREMEARVRLEDTDARKVRAAMDEFLRLTHCAAVATRAGDAYALVASARTRKRRSFLSATIREVQGGVDLDVTLGPKLAARELLDHLGRACARHREDDHREEPALHITSLAV